MAGNLGKFCWYELMTTDTASAARFYGEVVGWRSHDTGNPNSPYTLFTVGETHVAGLMGLSTEMLAAGARPGWIGYVAADDLDQSLAKLVSLGGKTHREPQDIPGVGRFAVVADPQGAVFVLFEPAPGSAPPPDAPPGTPGYTAWRELMAGERETAFAFYAALFGWAEDQAVDLGPMGIYQTFKSGDAPTGGMMTKPASLPAPFWTYYFAVEAIGAAAGRIAAGGGTVINGPMQVPGGGWIVQGLDPQGAMFALTSGSA